MKTTLPGPRCGPMSLTTAVAFGDESGVEWGITGLPTALVTRHGTGTADHQTADRLRRLAGAIAAGVNRPHRPPQLLGFRLRSRRSRVRRLGAVNALEYKSDAACLKNKIRFYNCLGEATLAGKPFLAAAGLLDDAEVALARHPASRPTPIRRISGRGSRSATDSRTAAPMRPATPGRTATPATFWSCSPRG